MVQDRGPLGCEWPEIGELGRLSTVPRTFASSCDLPVKLCAGIAELIFAAAENRECMGTISQHLVIRQALEDLYLYYKTISSHHSG